MLVITVVLSLLSRLHNLLKDDPNMEIQADYLSLWPASLSKYVYFKKLFFFVNNVELNLSWFMFQGHLYKM